MNIMDSTYTQNQLLDITPRVSNGWTLNKCMQSGIV